MRDICRWHVEEFAYLLGKMKATPEGDGTLLDHTCVVFAHEHAEANPHKDNGLALILAGHLGGMKTGMHSKMRNTIGDLYLTLAEEVFKQPLDKGFPTAEKKISGIV
jgi:4-hydroxy-3-methylbut-2-enyl diphosphate reductase IspH